MKLDVVLERQKDVRGRVLCHVAKLGYVEATGKTPAEAQAKLAELITTLCSEDATPVLLREPSDGHVWMAYRASWGQWHYGHFRPSKGSSLLESGSCYFGSFDRRSAVEAMRRDFDHYPREETHD